MPATGDAFRRLPVQHPRLPLGDRPAEVSCRTRACPPADRRDGPHLRRAKQRSRVHQEDDTSVLQVPYPSDDGGGRLTPTTAHPRGGGCAVSQSLRLTWADRLGVVSHLL